METFKENISEENKLSVIGNIVNFISQLPFEKDYEITITPVKVKRSKRANAYFWVICQKLAAKLQTTTVEIYRNYIRQIGVFETVEVAPEMLETTVRRWNALGIGWIADIVDNGDIEAGRRATINLYYGSSVYSTDEMSALINLLVEDCKELKIDTLPTSEIDKMIKCWRPE